MSDTFITGVAIIWAVVLVIVVPLVVTCQRGDNVSQLDVEALTSNFVDEMRATGKLTLDNYDKFLQNSLNYNSKFIFCKYFFLFLYLFRHLIITIHNFLVSNNDFNPL